MIWKLRRITILATFKKNLILKIFCDGYLSFAFKILVFSFTFETVLFFSQIAWKLHAHYIYIK